MLCNQTIRIHVGKLLLANSYLLESRVDVANLWTGKISGIQYLSASDVGVVSVYPARQLCGITLLLRPICLTADGSQSQHKSHHQEKLSPKYVAGPTDCV